ncbi:MAG TPA: hypothetical protein VK797_28000 [Tepidisphaeraceae bacterium]|jgi:hypothetical protein|nr:hypothetical protein [Tepidisphaeraceae bacterium]
MAKSARDANPRGYFYRRMRKHFGVDPATLVLVSQKSVSAAFIRELLRRATLLALEPLDGQASNGQPVRVEDQHVDAALEELIVAGGRLTQTLLGVAR